MVIKSHFLLQIIIREYTKICPHASVTIKQCEKIGTMNFNNSTVYFQILELEFFFQILHIEQNIT